MDHMELPLDDPPSVGTFNPVVPIFAPHLVALVPGVALAEMAGLDGADTAGLLKDLCAPCAEGSHQDAEGATECEPCKRGSYCPSGASVPLPCPGGTHKNLAALVGGRAASAPPSAHSGGTAASGGGAKKVLGAARRASQAVAAFSRDEKTVLSTAPSNDGLPLAVRSTAKVAPEPPEPRGD